MQTGIGISPKQRAAPNISTLLPLQHTPMMGSIIPNIPYDSQDKDKYSTRNRFKSLKRVDLRSIALSSFKSIRWIHLSLLLLLWFCIVHYYERILPYNTMKKCQWESWEDWKTDGQILAQPHRAIIIGDPQIIDDYSYPNRSKLMLGVTKRITDNFLHRNHVMYQRVLDPDSTLFIGDLFDGGRDWKDDMWFDEYERFHKIFSKSPSGGRSYLEIPGNHDIGFGDAVDLTVLRRFRTFFGEVNTFHVLGNHSFVMLDTISMSAFEHPELNTEPTKFTKDFALSDHPAKDYPRILLSHVPLWRFTDKQFCGPLRESKKKFPVMRGKQYQTVLEYQLSQNLMNFIKPKVVYSGDDHDYCHVRHPSSLQSQDDGNGSGAGEAFTDEITVKSSAMTGGIKKPAIQMISLLNPTDPEERSHIKFNTEIQETGDLITRYDTIQTRLCYLPDDYWAIKVYIFTFISFVISLVFVLTFPSTTRKINSIYNKRVLRSLNNKGPSPLDKELWEPKKGGSNGPIYMKLLAADWGIPEEKNYIGLAVNVAILGTMCVKIVTWYYNSI